MIKINIFESLFLKRFFKIHKRHRFILSAVLSSFLVLGSTFLSFQQLGIYLIFVFFLIYFFSFFSLLEEIKGIEWINLFILPIYFTLAFILFYFLLPVRWLTRLPFFLIYGVSIYAILLSANIFNVGVEKSLQLFRAASSVNYLFITLSSFFSFSLLISLRNNFVVNFLGGFLLTAPLAYQFVWSVNPKDTFSFDTLKLALIISFFVSQLALFFSFVPLRTNIFALLLTTALYSLLGITQAYLEEKLFKERIQEFIFVFFFVLIIVLLSAGW